jgi:hypothetical protein
MSARLPIVLSLLFSFCPQSPAEPPQSASFSVTGGWGYGAVPGHDPGLGTMYSAEAGATATWEPRVLSACPVRVSFWISPHQANTPEALIEITGPFGQRGFPLELRSGEPRWETLGVIDFSGDGRESLRLSNRGEGNLRVSAVKLEVLDPQDKNMVWQTLVLDDLAAYDPALLGPAADAMEVRTGPPEGEWTMVFSDDFDGDAPDPAKWRVSDGETWGKLLSVRMRGNVVVEDGLLRLVTRREDVLGKQWTTGMLGTGGLFAQAYGYWEARMRYAGAPGLNNAFWTRPPGKESDFEIDFNEGHWPNTVNISLHQDDLPSDQKAWRALVNLSRDFHVYGCLWTEKEVVFYWDGMEIGRKPNTKAHQPSPVIFSTAVIPWAGLAGDRLDGQSMDVDWVRVWAPGQTESPGQR